MAGRARRFENVSASLQNSLHLPVQEAPRGEARQSGFADVAQGLIHKPVHRLRGKQGLDKPLTPLANASPLTAAQVAGHSGPLIFPHRNRTAWGDGLRAPGSIQLCTAISYKRPTMEKATRGN